MTRDEIMTEARHIQHDMDTARTERMCAETVAFIANEMNRLREQAGFDPFAEL